MKLSQLREIVAVGEQGSLRAAARHLGTSQPAITRSIRDVEAELGAALFERSTTGVIPTEAGRLYLRRATAILSDLQRAKDEIRQLTDDKGGHVSIGLSTASHVALLPEALPAFRARYPQAHLQIIEGLLPNLQSKLESGALDFFIGPLTSQPLPKHLTSRLVFGHDGAIVCRFDHPLRDATRLAELVDARWVMPELEAAATASIIPFFARHGLPIPRIEMSTQSALTMLIAVAHSDLLALLPSTLLRYPPVQQSLRQIHIEEVPTALSVYTVQRAQSILTPAAQYFYDLMIKAGRAIER